LFEKSVHNLLLLKVCNKVSERGLNERVKI
jgi:hypothetical protein